MRVWSSWGDPVKPTGSWNPITNQAFRSCHWKEPKVKRSFYHWRLKLPHLRCRQRSPLDETINRSLPCVYACKKITYTRQGSCSPCLVDYGNTKTTQQALKVSVFNLLKMKKKVRRVSSSWFFVDVGFTCVLLTDQSKVPRLAQIWLVVLLHVRRNHRNRRLIGDRSPGWPPRLSHSSWALLPKLLSRRN